MKSYPLEPKSVLYGMIVAEHIRNIMNEIMKEIRCIYGE